MAAKYDCVACRKQVTATKNNRYRSHTDGTGDACEMSSVEIPEHVLAHPVSLDDAPDVPREGVDYAVCPQCERRVRLTRLGCFEPHDTTLRGGERCATTGVRAKHARKTETVPLPGDEPVPVAAARPAVTAQQEVERSAPSVGSSVFTGSGSPAFSISTPDSSSRQSTPSGNATATSSDARGSSEEPASAGEVPPVLHLAPLLGDGSILQPFSHIFQPGPVPERINAKEKMGDQGREIATRLREMFYAYTNRNASDNRSAQKTLGPSEIGSPCERQIAMKLLGIQPVNPQEGWAPFVGTAVHAELARMFEWANGAGSGRFVVEMPLSFGSRLVPKGTGDLLDRVLCIFMDHKLMGRYSLSKLVKEGPSPVYRAQVHTYGYGAELAGEKVKYVAIIGWPRQESSLDNLYVHVEPYDRQIALDAIKRVERIAAQTKYTDGADLMALAKSFPAGDDCKWCPFYLKADKEMRRGCPGK